MKETRWWGVLILTIAVAGWLITQEFTGEPDLGQWIVGGLMIPWPMKEA